jgi:hypothetical protein
MPIEGELTAPDDSLRSELEAAFGSDDAATTGDTGATGEVVQSGEGGGGETVDHAREPEGDSGRARGPDGKFLAKSAETEAKAAPEKVAAAPEIPSTDAAKASEVAAQTVANAPPAGWTAAEKAEWSKLSPVAQAAVSRREAEMPEADSSGPKKNGAMNQCCHLSRKRPEGME